jgi:competence CoiA-like predicted nuclease
VIRRLCPVCRQQVARTMGLNIQSHFDSLRLETCPGSGEPYRIALLWTPMFCGVTE